MTQSSAPILPRTVESKRSLAETFARMEASPESPETLAFLERAWANPIGRAIGFTGPPGVGKSTLVGALIKPLRERGLRVAVLAVDPSSQATHGALLGDRARIASDPTDPGVFVRSIATRDRLGGLAELAMPIVTLFRAHFDLVLIETVGVGQTETAIIDLADHIVFCAQPNAGDALQYMKAGVAEIPDIAVVCKNDLGAAATRAVADLRGALMMAARSGVPPEVLSVSATGGEGVEALAERLAGLSAPQDRQNQAQAWLHQTLVIRFGQEGVARLPPKMEEGEGPFAAAARLSQSFRAFLATYPI